MRVMSGRRVSRTPRLTAALAAATLLITCRPATTRPPFPPVPEAASTEIRLPPAEATRLLAEALRADSIPPARIELRDSWLETSWFVAATGQPVHYRALGQQVVRVRAWADPTHPGNCKVVVETVYRPLADPSVPQRELDRQVPRSHPVAIKVRATLQELVKRYGGPPPTTERPGETPEPGVAPEGEEPPPDEVQADTTSQEGSPSTTSP
jgi:hypothetical protein